MIYVERESQKAIVLGREGRQIQHVGVRSRKELEGIFNYPIHPFLHVKVSPQ